MSSSWTNTNYEILANETDLKKNLYEGIDFVFLPEFVGRYLHEIFGGDELILRKVKFIIIIVILFFERINSIFINRLEVEDLVL